MTFAEFLISEGHKDPDNVPINIIEQLSDEYEERCKIHGEEPKYE